MIDLKEIFVANGITVLMMWFLMTCRRQNRESIHTEDRVYDGMAFINMIGAVAETASFLIDAKTFTGGRLLNHVLNSLCYIGTVSIGLLWCLYVNLRIYRNYKQIRRCLRFVMLPWIVEMLMLVSNFFGSGLLFRITGDNVYQRGQGAVFGYIALMFYFAYTIYLVRHSKQQGINLSFFPVQYFVGPCIIGLVMQLLCYGITTSWISVSVALTFVQMQTYAENLYTDELSGLYNRRYMTRILANRSASNRSGFYGIMMDLNDFKSINDDFGHSVGDRAIARTGDILFRSIPEGGIAVRFAGDEFVVLLPQAEERTAVFTMEDIRKSLEAFNAATEEPFRLSMSMGCARFKPEEDAEDFLRRMDSRMYEEKRRYHEGKQR